ncbi:acyltransferase family protein [Aetokthonos hydrillicola]|jgi:peptidoglycan/LPS O-acetylase OafA/YrhL|nr:acyltransferase family protein [Aetokthonos hydrillicola]
MAYLDGIRGLAALYVVLVHSCDYNLSVPLEPALLWLALAKFLRYGIFAVVTFIVLSGYCLMLPIVRSNKRYFSGGLLEFFKRRIRRILPPYYAALIFCMLISGLVLWLENEGILGLSKEKFGELQGLFSPTFSFHDLLVYALLIQNLGLHFNKINGPTWTVAVEWQIYFVFAILLIPIWRRLGLWATLGISFVLGLSLKYLMGDEIAFNVCPWFIGLFALGMAAAEINFSKKPSLMRLNKSLPWGVLSIVFASLAFLTEWLRFGRVVGLEQWIVHYFVGLGAACLLIYCTNLLLNGKQLPPLLRLLESPWAVTLGVFSYSLYITHAPVVWLVHQLLLSLNLSPTLMATKWLIIGVPSSLMVAYLFHVAFERPFMSHFSVNIKSQKTKKNISPNSYNGLNASFDGDLTSTETKFSNSLKKLLEWLQDYMSVDTVTLLLPVKDQQDLAVYATLGLEEEIVQKIRIPIGRGFAGRIASSREPMIVNNLSNIEIVSPILREKGLQSLVGIPLPVKQNSIGVLHIGTFKSKQFTERDVKQLKEIANLIESMIADAGSADSELPTRSQENWNKPFVKGPNTYINTLYQFFTSNLETLKARLFTSKYKLVKIFTLLSFVAEPIQLS